MAFYGVTTADAQAVIEMALGGKAATQLYEGEKRFDIRVRYQKDFRDTEEKIYRTMIPTQNNGLTPLNEISIIRTLTGPAFIYRDNNRRYIPVKFSVRGRDLGSTIAEAQEKVNAQITVPRGYSIAWTGEFENQERAMKRLMLVVPLSILVIFVLLFGRQGGLGPALQELDIKIIKGEGAGMTQLGLYEIDGDTLKDLRRWPEALAAWLGDAGMVLFVPAAAVVLAAVATVRGLHVQVFQVQPRPAQEGAEVGEEEREDRKSVV